MTVKFRQIEVNGQNSVTLCSSSVKFSNSVAQRVKSGGDRGEGGGGLGQVGESPGGGGGGGFL